MDPSVQNDLDEEIGIGCLRLVELCDTVHLTVRTPICSVATPATSSEIFRPRSQATRTKNGCRYRTSFFIDIVCVSV